MSLLDDVLNDPDAYADLLQMLRTDLQLNPATDLYPPALSSAQARPWQVDAGAGNVTFSASVNSAATAISHRLGRVPAFIGAFNTTGAGMWFSTAAVTTVGANVFGSFTSAITGTFSFVWVAIG